MITKGSIVDCIKSTSIAGFDVSKKKPMRGRILRITNKKIGGNKVKMCLFCPEWQEDESYGYEISSKWLIEVRE